jgi:carboxyl-terminal processing protease
MAEKRIEGATMSHKTKRFFRGWVAIGIGVGLWVGGGLSPGLCAPSEDAYKNLRMLSDVIDIIEKNYVDPVDTKELIQRAIEGMVSSLDPHSSFMPPDAYEELQIDTEGRFTGIGVSIVLKDNMVTVVAPIEGTPAYKAGIKAGDVIVKVDGEPIKDLRMAVQKMRGPKGSKVLVTILRPEAKETLDLELARDVIPIESVRSAQLKPGYGYVWITHFREQTTQDVVAALKDLEKTDPALKGLVLDLRDNPGGLLPQAIEVADIFLNDGTILSIKGRVRKHTKVYKARPNAVRRDYPIAVLINGGSASASEIVAGALQDHKRAVVMGATSFGKGSVQTVEPIGDGYGLKLTIARYYTPSGRSIQARGIEPDIMVEPKDESETADPEKGLLKEKDLTNHLEGISAETPDDAQKPSKSKPLPLAPLLRRGPLDVERLARDNQVLRALDVLIGHDILRAGQ